ncbi:hypothetical protein Mgra_00010229 [Meloidogyne graminicola]|uniref:Uncharacterized protein n=1 Tax=Meloidogyne graminicola TaxID=189291 RepID=A0A8S9ZCP6_9BILA|nr:hypothetical protein Mgra_00010229 [Meloidogyne graminicola]
MIKQICYLSIRLFNKRLTNIIRQENLSPFFSQYVHKIETNLNNNSLPDVIEQDCKRWESALKENLKLKMEAHPWLDINLKCSDIFLYSRSSKFVISTENILKELTPKQKEYFSQILKVNSSVYFQISSSSNDQFLFPGIVVNVFKEGFSIYINKLIDDKKLFLNKNVQIRLAGTKTNIAQLEFLKNRNNWHTLPGYPLLLYAYKYNREGQIQQRNDPLELIKNEDFDAEDERLAIAAALNLNRGIVAVHVGGMTRTRLLAKYLHILTEEVKNLSFV